MENFIFINLLVKDFRIQRIITKLAAPLPKYNPLETI